MNVASGLVLEVFGIHGSTAKNMGLEVSNDVDERYHLEKSTMRLLVM